MTDRNDLFAEIEAMVTLYKPTLQAEARSTITRTLFADIVRNMEDRDFDTYISAISQIRSTSKKMPQSYQVHKVAKEISARAKLGRKPTTSDPGLEALEREYTQVMSDLTLTTGERYNKMRILASKIVQAQNRDKRCVVELCQNIGTVQVGSSWVSMIVTGKQVYASCYIFHQL